MDGNDTKVITILKEFYHANSNFGNSRSCIYYFRILVGLASSDDYSEVGAVARAISAFLLIIGLILLILALFVPKQNNGHKRLESEAIEKSEDKSKLYANGHFENNMDMNGLGFKDYAITIDKDNIYLKEKDQ